MGLVDRFGGDWGDAHWPLGADGLGATCLCGSTDGGDSDDEPFGNLLCWGFAPFCTEDGCAQWPFLGTGLELGDHSAVNWFGGHGWVNDSRSSSSLLGWPR